MTLHFFFPHEFIPALDLLDRGLVTRLMIGSLSSPSNVSDNEVFYVQSASSQTKTTRQRRHHYTSVSSANYEVRLGAWNCTCPAFALSTFSRLTDLKSNGDADDNREPLQNSLAGADHDNVEFYDSAQPQTDFDWRFGGTFTRTLSDSEYGTDSERRGASVSVPVCKHILAALLGKYTPGLFGSGVQLRTVSGEEGAGWAGGWGDGD